MFDKYHKAILRRLYNSGEFNLRHTPIENATKGFPKSDIGRAKEALDDLIKWDYIKIKKTHHGKDVYLNIKRKADIEKILEPDLPYILNYTNERDTSPLETYINEGYENKPFFISKASHNILGRTPSEYRYHKNSNSEILTIIPSKGQEPYRIRLGSFSDPKSLLSKALVKIDKKFGKEVFNRADLNDLDRDIVGNKQNLKAVIDMMIFYKYLNEIKRGKTYQRTERKRPPSKMDDY